jgi:sporulation protein YlmC with PRC-barrel domain
MRLTDLVNSQCVTEDGRVLGRVFEFRARHTGDGTLEIEDLLLGRHALVERYGAGRHRPPGRRQGDTVHEVPWSDVVRIEERRVVVRRPE